MKSYNFSGSKLPSNDDIAELKQNWDFDISPFDNALKLYEDEELDLCFEFVAEEGFYRELNKRKGVNGFLNGYKEYSIKFFNEEERIGKIHLNYLGWIIGEVSNSSLTEHHSKKTDFVAGKLILNEHNGSTGLEIKLLQIEPPNSSLWGIKRCYDSKRIMNQYSFYKETFDVIAGEYIKPGVEIIPQDKRIKHQNLFLEKEIKITKDPVLIIE